MLASDRQNAGWIFFKPRFSGAAEVYLGPYQRSAITSHLENLPNLLKKTTELSH